MKLSHGGGCQRPNSHHTKVRKANQARFKVPLHNVKSRAGYSSDAGAVQGRQAPPLLVDQASKKRLGVIPNWRLNMVANALGLS